MKQEMKGYVITKDKKYFSRKGWVDTLEGANYFLSEESARLKGTGEGKLIAVKVTVTTKLEEA